MPQENELLEKLRAKRAERTAQRNALRDRRRLMIVGGAVGAAILLAVILCLIFIRPAPDTDPTTARFTDTPKGIFVLGNVDAAKELYFASELTDKDFQAHLDQIGFESDIELALLRKYVTDLYDIIRRVALPSHPNGVSTIYYNPNGGQMELIYNINGVQYHFLINCIQAEYSGTPASPYGRRFGNTYFPMYKIDSMLYGDFGASGKTMALRINTTDLEKVDLSEFSLRIIAY